MMIEPYFTETFPSSFKNHYIHNVKFGNILGKADAKKKKVIYYIFEMYGMYCEDMENIQGDLIVTNETHDETPEGTIQKCNYLLKKLDELIKLGIEPEQKLLPNRGRLLQNLDEELIDGFKNFPGGYR